MISNIVAVNVNTTPQMKVLKITFDYINSIVKNLPRPEKPFNTHVIKRANSPGRDHVDQRETCVEAW